MAIAIAPVPDLRRWLGRFGLAMALSCAVALLLSLQFLAQPFVWRSWTVPEVLDGWLLQLRDRLTVATLIAFAIVFAQAVPLRSPWWRSGVLAVATFLAAMLGELVVQSLSGFGAISLLPSSLRWMLFSLAAAGTLHLWRSSRETRAALERESLRQLSIEQQLTSTRLAALRSQIEPHFLFNSLATIRHLQGKDPEAGAVLLAHFVDYLRRMLPMTELREVRLDEEVALVRAYLQIMSVRMSGRLRTHIELPAELEDAAVPPLALATLVENAIKHGLTPSPCGGELQVVARAQQGLLRLRVSDTGVGLGGGSSGPGMGLSNVRARLTTLYGSRGSLQVTANASGGVLAEIQLPCRAFGGTR